MAIKTKEYLKTRFESGDKPTGQDFQDLLDSLVGKEEPAVSNTWQPPNSPVYLEQGQEVTITHPTIVNEVYQISINEEIAGVSGQTNISIDFAQAAEVTNYIQEDALLGTDFIDGIVSLHGTKGIGSYSDPYSVGDRTALIEVTSTGTWNRNTVLSNFVVGSNINGGVNPLTLSNNTIVFNFKDVKKVIEEFNIGISLNGYTEYGVWQVEGSNSVNGPWVKLSEPQPFNNTPWICSGTTPYSVFRLKHISGTTPGDMPYVFQATFKLADIKYPSQSYLISTNDASHFGFSQAEKIESLSVASNVPTETSILCAASFDGRSTWKKWNGVQWVEISDVKTQGNTISELQTGFINLARTTEDYIDLAFVLGTTNVKKTPSIDHVTIVYQDSSHYEISTIGKYDSTSDFGLKRVNPTTSIVKRLNSNSGKVFITMNIG